MARIPRLDEALLRIPGILTQSAYLAPEATDREVAARIQWLENAPHPREKFFCLRTRKSVESIYWIFALLLSGRKFSLVGDSAIAGEAELIRKCLGDWVDLEPLLSVGGEGRVALKDIALQPESAELAIFSSGTTGERRAICLTYANLKASALAHGSHLSQSPDDIWLAALPFQHVGGLSLLTRALLLGQDLAFSADASVGALLSWMESGKISAVSLVPTMLLRITEEMRTRRQKFNGSALRFALVGGDRASSELMESARALGVPALATYGLSEAASQVATQMHPAEPGLRLLPHLSARLAADGELELKGESVSRGYFVGGELVGRESAWLATGDIAQIHQTDDKISTLTFLARKKEIIVSGGVKIIPSEVEEIFLRTTGMQECVLIGMPDSEWGERAVLIFVGDRDLSTEDCALLKRALGGPRNPRDFVRQAAIPKNALGKISRKEIRRLYLLSLGREES